MPKRMIADVIAGRPLITGSAGMMVREACKLMADNKIGAVLIVDKEQRLAGIFTERDALNKILAAGVDPDKTPLSKVMVKDIQTIKAEKPLAFALYMMAEGGFRHVPVVDDKGCPVGMVSARDALGEEIIDVEREMKHLEDIESSIGY